MTCFGFDERCGPRLWLRWWMCPWCLIGTERYAVNSAAGPRPLLERSMRIDHWTVDVSDLLDE